jgi:hypothetical protein
MSARIEIGRSEQHERSHRNEHGPLRGDRAPRDRAPPSTRRAGR